MTYHICIKTKQNPTEVLYNNKHATFEDITFARHYAQTLVQKFYEEEFAEKDGFPTKREIQQELADLYYDGNRLAVNPTMVRQFYLSWIAEVIDYTVTEEGLYEEML